MAGKDLVTLIVGRCRGHKENKMSCVLQVGKRLVTYKNQRKVSVAAGSEVGVGMREWKLEQSGKYSHQ